MEVTPRRECVRIFGVLCRTIRAPHMSTRLRRAVFLRGLGATHLIAAGSLWTQAGGLFGPGGILPFDAFLADVGANSTNATLEVPTWLWLLPTQQGLDGLFALHCLLATLLLFGARPEGWLLLGLFSTWISICNVGGVFLGFQWDALLAECTVVALFVARFRLGEREPATWGWWMVWGLLGRLMFFGGFAKLTSGDPTWRDSSALTYHYWTQPLPNPLSLWFHRMPFIVHDASVHFMFLVELVFPWLIPFGRSARRVAFTGFAMLMALLAVSGNYGYFQILALVLCFTLLDEVDLKAFFPGPTAVEAPPTGPWLLPAALLLLAVQVGWYADVRVVQEWVYPWHLTSRYGLFARMTTERPEVRLEGTWDGKTWSEIPTRWTPDDADGWPLQVAPHHPRLDWQLWFAGLGSCRRNPWLVATMTQIATGNVRVTSLLSLDPAGEPPRRVRAQVALYTPAAPDSAHVWEIGAWKPYCDFEVDASGPVR